MKRGGASAKGLPDTGGGGRLLAALIPITLLVAAGSGCAPVRQRLVGEEARTAAVLFASAAEVSFPLRASFTGIAGLSGRTVPFIAGLSSRNASEEIVGIYDPLGRAILFLRNDGGILSVTRGPAAKEFPPEDVRQVDAGPLSVGRVLWGVPGYPVGRGVTARAADGGWVFEGKRQTLFSDPSRRLFSRAEYDISGKRVTVTYPERDSSGPPKTVEIEVMGNRILLRRDAE